MQNSACCLAVSFSNPLAISGLNAQERPLDSEVTTVSELLIYPKGLQAAVGLSFTTAKRLIAAGVFPAPVRISPRRVAWRRTDLEAWVQRRESEMTDTA